jgi:hypothetical protein
MVIGTAFVGFSEEMATRGFTLAVFRNSFESEKKTWLVEFDLQPDARTDSISSKDSSGSRV